MLRFDGYLLDVAQGILLRDGERVPLAPKPFLILATLAERRGEVVTKADLIRQVWPDTFVEESSLTQCIFLLRKAIGRSGGKEIVETIPKRGYRIAVPVETVTSVFTQTTPEPVPDPIPAVQVETFPHPPVVSQPSRRAWLRPVLLWAASLAVAALLGFGWHAFLGDSPVVLSAVRLTSDGFYKERLLTLLTDDRKIYFTEDLDADTYLAEAPAEGGELVRRPPARAADSALAFSAARNEMLFAPLWEQDPDRPFAVLSMRDGSTHSLGNLSGHAAAWSRDGSRIAFAHDMSLLVANADGSDRREILRLREAPYWVRWSPDGRRIRFSLPPGPEEAGIWEVGATGDDPHPVFRSEGWSAQACCGDWSPDGRYFLFVRDEARRSSLWVARDSPHFWQSAAPVRLAEGPVDFWRAPVMSTAADRVYALGEVAKGELVRFNPATRQFEPWQTGLSTDTLSFSSDGQWMAWTAYPEGTLWRSHADGSERLRLTEPGRIARFPRWSPDGAEISYITTDSEGRWHIDCIAAAGGVPQPLTANGRDEGVPSWSPDGQEIAYGQLVHFGEDRGGEQQIRVYNRRTKTSSTLPGSNGLWTARWSPTGEYLSAVTVDNRQLRLFNRRTSQWSTLAEVGTNDTVWSHDGQYLFFDSPNDPTIYRVHVPTRRVEKYASLKGIRRTGFYGWSLNLAPDDTPVLLREAGVNEVYSLKVHLP